jgi:YesN/AraC family two-component response regulator
MGHTGTSAVNGVDALERFAENYFDMVITDINICRMDVTELIKTIKADIPA